MTEMERAERFAQKAPPLNQVERDAINDLFPAYIFRRSHTDEIWTTCCHKHMTVADRDMMVTTPERNFLAVMWEPHQREAKNRWQDAPQPTVQCPLCGKMVIVKELRYTGRRENLSSWRRAVVLRWYRGALWAKAYDCGKHYSDGYSLTGEPECKLIGVYRFKPGLAEATTRYYYSGNYPFNSIERQDGPLVKGHWNIHGPFNANAEYGVGYDVIGLEEIQKSPFRYCMAEEAEHKFSKFLEYLTACCFYPRQIEMLMKAGMSDVVRDLVERGVKHATVINWDEPSPAKAFKVSRQDMKAFLDTNRNIEIMELHKRLKGRIPIPAGKNEILDEGRKLQHCVSGYADRHMNGTVTILFMREAKKPGVPWLTIEMDGNKLRQIHGFKNEGLYTTKGRFAPDPREVYREFLDTWLDWLKKGSKRDKQGNPKLPRKKGAAA